MIIKKRIKIEVYAGMAERLVRGLAIEEAQTRKKITTRLNLPLHMIWADRRDNPVGDMNPLAGMPSSLVEEARG